ncbi:MAG: cation diffusion facilitator family transporter [Planctomycetota bacterium]|jgi:cation diffusion facilitator family transporter
MISKQCINCAKKVEWVVLAINFALFIIKGSFALISHSKSLLTDSFQSLANFIITIVVLASLTMASRRADEKFPYGYGKVEFLASGIVNMLLMIAAKVFIIISFLEMIMVGPEKPPKMIAIVAAAVSIIANYIAFGYARCAGEKIASTAILTNAEVSRADVGTSIAVIFAVVGSNLGFSRLDHIAAIVICVLIVKVTFDGLKRAIKGLMDVSLRTEELRIRNLIEDIDGIRSVGNIRARLAGRSLLVELDIFLPADWALRRGLEIVQNIKSVLNKKMSDLSNVSVQLLPAIETDVRRYKTRRPSAKPEKD